MAQRYELVYLSPSSELATVPFAALSLDGGAFLAEHCATAYAPSTSVLQWCIGRRRPLVPTRFLAFGAGGTKDEDGREISFAAQARAIAERVAQLPEASSRLLPDTTLPDELLDSAQIATVLHFECHGYLDSTVSSVLSSYLRFSEEPRIQLDAQQVAQPARSDPGRARVSRCLPVGHVQRDDEERGRRLLAGVPGGGRRVAGGDLSPIDPRRASELVTGFDHHWLGAGAGRAQALRAAQLALLGSGRGPEDWATHIVIGDGG